jgi:hypothetical protein
MLPPSPLPRCRWTLRRCRRTQRSVSVASRGPFSRERRRESALSRGALARPRTRERRAYPAPPPPVGGRHSTEICLIRYLGPGRWFAQTCARAQRRTCESALSRCLAARAPRGRRAFRPLAEPRIGSGHPPFGHTRLRARPRRARLTARPLSRAIRQVLAAARAPRPCAPLHRARGPSARTAWSPLSTPAARAWA